MAYHLVSGESSENLDYFTSLRGKKGHLEAGVFIAEGPKVVPKILASKFQIVSGYMTGEYLDRLQSDLLQHFESIEITIASKEAMEKVVGYPLHQGVMLAVRIPESPSIREIVERAAKPQLFVALDGIADAENMGTIIRNAAGLGATAVLVDEQSCHPFLRRSVRVSMGTIVDIPIIRVSKLETALAELRRMGSRVVGAALREESQSLYETRLDGELTLVLGAEGHGISRSILEQCECTIAIPMHVGVDSLNVGVASGILLSEVMRQRAADRPTKLDAPP